MQTSPERYLYIKDTATVSRGDRQSMGLLICIGGGLCYSLLTAMMKARGRSELVLTAAPADLLLIKIKRANPVGTHILVLCLPQRLPAPWASLLLGDTQKNVNFKSTMSKIYSGLKKPIFK